jgi:hypothetical protein
MQKLWIFLFLMPIGLFANPFKIDFPVKESLSNEDYIEVQERLGKVDIRAIFDDFYPKKPPTKRFLPWTSAIATKEDFFRRISKALSQKLIDKESSCFPIQKLVKIGNGGENCLVCYASLNGKYKELIQNLPKQLESVGFNGHLFYRIGGFPNPTGKEIQYAGVPYSFKIFALLEAQKQGFSKVLWLDCAFTPLKDPTPLFDWIAKEGSFLKLHGSFPKFILPKTKEYIEKVTGVDVLKARYVSAQVLGFDLENPCVKKFITEYYRLVEMGYPFFSCFPEEYVFSSIVGQKPENWKAQPYKNLVFSEEKLKGKDILWAKKEGYFFLQRIH